MHSTRPTIFAAPRGFTLLELMLVVGIIGILASLAIGFSGTFYRKERVKQAARGLQSAIALARAEAVRTSSTITVVLHPQHIYVFKDVNGNGTFDAGEPKIFDYPTAGSAALPSSLTFTSTDLPSITGTPYPTVYLNYEGLSYGPSGLRSGHVCVKDSTLPEVRAVQMTTAAACRIQANAAAVALCP